MHRPEQMERARAVIDEYNESIVRVDDQRLSLLQQIAEQNKSLDSLHYELTEVIEQEEMRRAEWLVERESEEMPTHVQVMPWSRGYEEDQRFRKSLASSMLGVALLALLIGTIAIPIAEREAIDELPERMAKLVREQLPPPPPPVPVEEPQVAEEIPERNLSRAGAGARRTGTVAGSRAGIRRSTCRCGSRAGYERTGQIERNSRLS